MPPRKSTEATMRATVVTIQRITKCCTPTRYSNFRVSRNSLCKIRLRSHADGIRFPPQNRGAKTKIYKGKNWRHISGRIGWNAFERTTKGADQAKIDKEKRNRFHSEDAGEKTSIKSQADNWTFR